MTAGAALGGALVAAVGVTAAFAVNAASFLADVAVLSSIREGESPQVKRAPRQVREGLGYVARTPGLLSFDASVDRIFSVKEGFRLDVRVDAFNAINHTNFASPSQTGIQIPAIASGVSSALNSATFGRITSAGDPRIFQFSLKLLF